MDPRVMPMRDYIANYGPINKLDKEFAVTYFLMRKAGPMKMLSIKKILIIGASIVLIALLPYIIVSGENDAIDSELSEKIISKIYKKYIPVYKKYSGIESLRNLDIIEYNPDSTTLINRSNVSMIRKDYFYKKPEITVLQYILNDTYKQPSDYESREIGPENLVIDEKGKELYLTRIMQEAIVSDQKCYKMRVIPRERKPEHFEGYMYFKKDTLELMLVEGTLGTLPHSLKEYSMKQYFDHVHDLPVMRSGSCVMRYYIPLLQPDRRFVFSIKVINNIPMME
jgi:hypothetical protein